MIRMVAALVNEVGSSIMVSDGWEKKRSSTPEKTILRIDAIQIEKIVPIKTCERFNRLFVCVCPWKR